MKPIDWRRLLEEHRIPYVERGANVSRGEINIQCPFCGSADPSHHLGLNLESGWWACWRNQNHRGKSPLRLLIKLLRVPYWKALEIAGLDKSYVDPEGFDAVAARIMGRESLTRIEEVRREFLSIPKEFRSLGAGAVFSRHRNYLINKRGFPERDLETLVTDYQLMGAVSGKFSDRVIFPYFVNGELVTWTGRAIADSAIRYRDLSVDESLIPPKQTFYNHDAIITGGKTLLVVEGPMDVAKLDFYGRPYGVRAVGLSTNSIQEEQIFLLEDAVSQFDSILVMLDMASSLGIADSMRLKEKLMHIPKVGIRAFPSPYKDGGEMPPRAVTTFCKGLLK